MKKITLEMIEGIELDEIDIQHLPAGFRGVEDFVDCKIDKTGSTFSSEGFPLYYNLKEIL